MLSYYVVLRSTVHYVIGMYVTGNSEARVQGHCGVRWRQIVCNIMVESWPRGHVVKGPRGHVVTWACDHVAMWLRGHVIMWSYGHVMEYE